MRYSWLPILCLSLSIFTATLTSCGPKRPPITQEQAVRVTQIVLDGIAPMLARLQQADVDARTLPTSTEADKLTIRNEVATDWADATNALTTAQSALGAWRVAALSGVANVGALAQQAQAAACSLVVVLKNHGIELSALTAPFCGE